MKEKIMFFNLNNCSFSEYKNELFCLNEDHLESPIELLNSFILKREKNIPDSLLIFEDLYNSLETRINSKKYLSGKRKYQDIILPPAKRKKKSNTNNLLQMINESTEPSEDFYTDSLFYNAVSRYFKDGESIYLEKIKEKMNLSLLDLVCLQANDYKKDILFFNDFLNIFFSDKPNLNIFNLSEVVLDRYNIIEYSSYEELKKMVIGKEIYFDDDLYNIILENKDSHKKILFLEKLIETAEPKESKKYAMTVSELEKGILKNNKVEISNWNTNNTKKRL